MKEEEYEELDNDHGDFDQEMGAGIDPVEEARKPKKRRGKFLALGGFGIVVAVIVAVALRGRASQGPEKNIGQDTLNLGSGKAVAVAAPSTTTSTEAPSLMAVDTSSKTVADTSQRLIDERALTTPSTPTLGTTASNSGGAESGNQNNGVTSNFPTAGSVMANLPSVSESNQGNGVSTGYNNSNQAQESGPTPRERFMAREAAKRQADSLKAIAYAKWVVDQQSKLRRPTQVSLGGGGEGSEGSAASNVGTSRFGNDAPAGSGGDNNSASAGGTENSNSDNSSNLEAGATQTINGISIPPGARVRAVTMTEYRSDLEGDQTLQIQLQEPLRVNGRTVLPAGTIGYGKVSSSAGAAGRSAYIQMNVSTFQTRQGQVIRGVRAQAGDPETYAMAIKGKTDNRLGERIARGLAATVLDIGFAATSQKMAYKISGQTQAGGTYGLTPSPTDVALLRTQERAQPIINAAVGDENSVQPAVILKRGTPFVLFFGF